MWYKIIWLNPYIGGLHFFTIFLFKVHIKFKVYVNFNIKLNLNFCEWKESIAQFSKLNALNDSLWITAQMGWISVTVPHCVGQTVRTVPANRNELNVNSSLVCILLQLRSQPKGHRLSDHLLLPKMSKLTFF